MKKDDYLTSMMMIPPKQPTRINQFDVRTQQEAFAVSLEGLKGVCPTSCLSVMSFRSHITLALSSGM